MTYGGLLLEVLGCPAAGDHADVPQILHWDLGVITLIPKVVGVTDIRYFRPITVINVLEWIFVKDCATRLPPIVERIAHPLQTAFLKGQLIHNGILALHEIVHEVASRGHRGVFLKLDFQKAYDRSAGLGIIASHRMNVALMLQWVWRILRGDGGLWLQLLQAKYLRGEPLLACSRSGGSQLWKSIQRIKEDIRLGVFFSTDVFNAFKNEDGSFREDITNDPRGLLSLYNAAHLLIHDEPSLQEAISFARHHLELMRGSLKSPLAEHVKRAFDIPFPRTVKRELKYLTKWSDDFYGYVGLNYVCDRLVEGYFAPYAVYHEKNFTLSRIFFTKLMVLMTMIDDTYDSHATIEEIRQLNAAIQRWDENATSLLPDYLKRFYNELLKIFKDAEDEAFIDTYHVAYARKAFQKFSTYHLQEAEWSHENHKASFEDFLNLSSMSVGLAGLSVVLMVGMGDEVTKEAFEWATSFPNIIIAGGKILRLFDDIAAFKGEKGKADVATCLESYMVEHRVTSKVAIARIHSLIEDEWKTINEAHFEHGAPLPVVKRILNLINSGTIYYGDQKDGFTFGMHLQKTIESLFVNPIPM
ncbi:tau-cadinol synthase-like [Triticum aestivum]|uniref:tau-cadinol synthase-like n=1 Tax=Triticum aestivum TaxID=4565 RepID=UPI001D0272A6|nr:tau-cadinol synthase-like [Triticum aestivum]